MYNINRRKFLAILDADVVLYYLLAPLFNYERKQLSIISDVKINNKRQLPMKISEINQN